jgi:ferrous iron transport protein B
MHALLEQVDAVASGAVATRPLRVAGTGEFQRAVEELVPMIEQLAPGVPNARWIAIRLLDGDAEVESALTTGRLAQLASDQLKAAPKFSRKMALDGAQ